jgi:GT2 family glycosyltransferase/Flp pilus assembly protein TadD
MPRYLLGPVDADFARPLVAARSAGDCLTFGHRPAEGVDLVLGSGAWDDLCARLPDGWQPDFVVLRLAYQVVPVGLLAAPVPLVALAADWNLLWSHYRRLLPHVDAVLTDAPGVAVLTRAGLDHALPANLFGSGPEWFQEEPAPERDLDVVFVGNCHGAVQSERLPWLGRLARLAGHRRVRLAGGVFGADYRRLLRRARVVFNRSIRSECNQRVGEALAAGALLFQEAGNAEVAALLADGREAIFYDETNLERLLKHYLNHEDERAAAAAAGQARAADFTFAALWTQALGRLHDAWPRVQERASARRPLPTREALLLRTGQLLCSEHPGDDRALFEELPAAAAAAPADAALAQAAGLLHGVRRDLARAADEFGRAVARTSVPLLPGLGLCEALHLLGHRTEPVAAARSLLALLERQAEEEPAVEPDLDLGAFPVAFDAFRVEWERAGWGHAGDPAGEARVKRTLLRWRLHDLLAGWTGELAHYYEAVLARPDLAGSRAALGCALGRAGRPAEAATHLRRAVAANPFDAQAARALAQALAESGETEAAAQLVGERRLLHQAAPELMRHEEWFAAAAEPVGLTSLIVLCCNEVAFTRFCLESVLARTRPPYELILVDNGSTDETPAYLESLKGRPGPARVVVVRNERNVGFPAGCNQGIRQAQGEQLLFLNNDTVVAEGWLEGLLACLRSAPDVGLAGAVSNGVPEPQRVVPPEQDVRLLDETAARRQREFAGQGLDVPRLSGFCFVGRRAVLEQVGGFDERYGLGFFDDDDLGLRVRRAGCKLRVALDVFVHHFGSRTFHGLGIDPARQLADNLARFRDKWGEAEAAPYRLPPSAAAPPPKEGGAEGLRPDVVLVGATAPSAAPAGLSARRPVGPYTGLVSLCLIVRNEEENLPACLAGAAGLFGEVIVVDTGSTDRTKEIARAHGARVFDFAWVDSFAAARNACLEHATGDWIFWLDADDRLDADNRDRLRLLLPSLSDENAAYVLKCLCVPRDPGDSGTLVDHVRLFRRRPDLRWEHRVHEQILGALRRSGAAVRYADVVVRHVGYVDPALRKRKLERDLRLLELERAELGDHPFTLFNLGSVYQELGRHAEAVALLRRSLERSHPQDSIVRKLYSLLAHCHKGLGRPDEALSACEAGLGVCPEDSELLFVRSSLLMEQGDLAGAEGGFRHLLRTAAGKYLGSVADGLRGHKARTNLAVVLQRQGRSAEAEEQWRQALRERPGYPPALLGLAELLLTQGRWGDLEAVAAAWSAHFPDTVEPLLWRGRGHLARQEFGAAVGLLREAAARCPRDPWPRVLLAQTLVQEGRDPEAAERALADVLALQPDHPQARQQLALLRSGGKPGTATNL